MRNPFKFKDMKIKEFEVYETASVEVVEKIKSINDLLGIYLVRTEKDIVPVTVWDNGSQLEQGKYLLVPNGTGKSVNLIKRD